MIRVTRLGPIDVPRIRQHLQALDADDRMLRFGHALRDEGIDHYAARIDFARDHVLGIVTTDDSLAALVHLGIRDDCADFGLSVHPAWRRCGLGWRLFSHVVTCCRETGVAALVCHSVNPAVVHMAAVLGFRRRRADPSEALVLALRKPVLPHTPTHIAAA